MPLFCKQCNGRRVPIFQEEENTSLWLCEKCKNFVDEKDFIVREQTDQERQDIERKLKEFEETSNFPSEKLSRRKGVN